MKLAIVTISLLIASAAATVACPSGTHPVCQYNGGVSHCTCVR